MVSNAALISVVSNHARCGEGQRGATTQRPSVRQQPRPAMSCCSTGTEVCALGKCSHHAAIPLRPPTNARSNRHPHGHQLLPLALPPSVRKHTDRPPRCDHRTHRTPRGAAATSIVDGVCHRRGTQQRGAVDRAAAAQERTWRARPRGLARGNVWPHLSVARGAAWPALEQIH